MPEPRKRKKTTGTELALPLDPWEKQPDESEKAFEAFAIYRDAGVLRSLTELARRLHEAYPSRFKTVDSARTVVAGWSRAHGWVSRVEAWTIAEDRRRRAKRDADRNEMEETHLALSRSLLVPVLTRLRGTRDDVENPVKALAATEIDSFGEAARVAETAVRIERLTRGLATDVTKGMDAFSYAEVASLVSDMVDDALGRMPEEQAEPFLQFVRERTANMRSR